MLFDEKDLMIFESSESKNYFKEILQSYYSQNYRATIVLLYSFVIYDLFTKLQIMADEGDPKANIELNAIKTMISDDKKYSEVENHIIKFYHDNCSLYFEKFTTDITYLKNLRNDCAHLRINGSGLFMPKDYQARMLICSMFDNVLSVRAPFIMDIFEIAKSDIETFSSQIILPFATGLNDNIKNKIQNKYLERMSLNSIIKSYKTFFRLLLISDDEDSIKNISGLYAFVYSMTDYIIKHGYIKDVFKDAAILSCFNKLDIEKISKNNERKQCIILLIAQFEIIMENVKSNNVVFDYLSQVVLNDPYGLQDYYKYFPRSGKTMFTYFKENRKLHQSSFIRNLYSYLKNEDDFSLYDFLFTMVNAIPANMGYDDADVFTNFFIEHLQELNIEQINMIMTKYNANGQCTNRNRHSSDIIKINDYINKLNANSY